jgi:integrase/recombinase XerD
VTQLSPLGTSGRPRGPRERPPVLVLVREDENALSVTKLTELYLQYRLTHTTKLSRSRIDGLQRTLRGFAEVVDTTTLDESAVKRWVASRADVAPCTRYDEFCIVRACCTWLGDRCYITPIDWSLSEWPRSLKGRGHRAAVEEARACEQQLEEYLYGVGLAQRSVVEYVHELARARRWFAEKGHDLATVPPSVVGAYANTRAPSWSTRKMVRAALTHYWEMTERRNPPVRAIRVPPKPRGRCRALQEGDTITLAEAARTRGDDPGLAVALMLYAGLRRAEVATLRWECFDADFRWMTIQGKFDIESTIPVHGRLRPMLLEKGPATGWIFPGRFAGRPSTGARIWNWVALVAREAGVSEVTPHRLRHAAVATVNDNTGDLRAAQDFARHADPRTTAIYTRTTERRLKAAVDAIDY